LLKASSPCGFFQTRNEQFQCRAAAWTSIILRSGHD
jgi:hypothetical protein